MKTLILGMLLFSGLSFAESGPYFECEFSYLKNGEAQIDVLTSHGQQSSKVEGFLSAVSNQHSVWNETESRSEARYYVNLYEVDVEGLNHLKSIAITENDLKNAPNIGSSVKSFRLNKNKTQITVECIRH